MPGKAGLLQTKSYMKKIQLLILLVFIGLFGQAQDNAKAYTEAPVSFGTFNTVNQKNEVSVNPAISGSLGSFYFENRYNYEAANSASLNVGRSIFKNLRHISIVPMVGVVVGSFKGFTAELQTSFENNRWSLSTDNQFSAAFTQSSKSMYLNWTYARYKVTPFFQIGPTSVASQQVNQRMAFDKGITAVLLIKQWSMRTYVYNYKKGEMYFWLSLRYNLKLLLK